MLGARDQLLQRRHHLAAVAGAERKRIAAREELLELGPDPGVEQDRARPAAAGAEHVAVGKSAARGKALEPRQRGAAGISTWPFTPCSRRIAMRGRTPVAGVTSFS